MNTITDIELRRARWRRHLAVQRLDSIDRKDFAVGGLGSRIKDPTARLLLLPPDPDREMFTFDAEFWGRLDELKTVKLDEFGDVSFGEDRIPTAHAAALVPYGGEHPWASYLAVHRNGAIECGLGSRGGGRFKNRNGEEARYFNLISIVRYSEAVLKLARQVVREPDDEWQLTLGLVDTREALVDDLAARWRHFPEMEPGLSHCLDNNLVWHIELDHLPADASESRRLAFAIGDRVENAWGIQQSRYLGREVRPFDQLQSRLSFHESP